MVCLSNWIKWKWICSNNNRSPHFTGLQDTPSVITNNRVLFTKNGNINFIEPTGLALKLTDLTDTPKTITDGKF